MEEWCRSLRAGIASVDERVVDLLERHGHRLHRRSLGVSFVWLGLLKPMDHETTTSLLAHAVYRGSPETMVFRGGGRSRSASACSTTRSSASHSSCSSSAGTVAFALLPEVTFVEFPFVPTPAGQYLPKDLAPFFAAMAIGGSLRHER